MLRANALMFVIWGGGGERHKRTNSGSRGNSERMFFQVLFGLMSKKTTVYIYQFFTIAHLATLVELSDGGLCAGFNPRHAGYCFSVL